MEVEQGGNFPFSLKLTDTRTRNTSTFPEASEYQQQTVYMNAISESQLEARCMKSILRTRTKLKIDFWYVRTMFEARVNTKPIKTSVIQVYSQQMRQKMR